MKIKDQKRKGGQSVVGAQEHIIEYVDCLDATNGAMKGTITGFAG